jgi:hypothetical protein
VKRGNNRVKEEGEEIDRCMEKEGWRWRRRGR